MPAPNHSPAISFFSALSVAPLRPLHTFLRTTGERVRPSQIVPYRPVQSAAQHAVLARSPDAAERRAPVLCARGAGRVPTIVLGGLVPDATEQVFLLRRFLLRSGDVYYVNYPAGGFSLEMLGAQLTDLVAELGAAGQPPVIFAVSFGAGVVLDWLRRLRCARQEVALAGVVFVSPVTCVADVVAPGSAKSQTLLGRSLKPLLEPSKFAPEAAVAKSRSLFLRMFEAGAQNKPALRLLMTEREAEGLRAAVTATIRGVTVDGARERVRALADMIAPTDYFSPRVLPLTTAPALVLFAEQEDAVLDAEAPVRFALERATRAYCPNGIARCVRARPGRHAVQHASLVFHVFEFLPELQAFYQRVRRASLAVAA